MKKLVTTLALSAMATISNAAVVATFDVSQSGLVTDPQAAGTITGTGTATLDDSGIFTMESSSTTDLLIYGSVQGVATLDASTIVNGSLSGSSFSVTSGTQTVTACTEGVNGGLICGGAPVGDELPFAFDQNPLVFDLSAVGAITELTTNAADPGNASTYSFTVTSIVAPEVPVPAAAWLFGSALLGLAGVGRRRKA